MSKISLKFDRIKLSTGEMCPNVLLLLCLISCGDLRLQSYTRLIKPSHQEKWTCLNK